MINSNMRQYAYSTLGGEDEYGQPQTSAEIKGYIKMSIDITTQTIQDNINYSGAQYLGLTLAPVDDSYIIHYGDKDLKVLNVNPRGRFKQVFMAEM